MGLTKDSVLHALFHSEPRGLTAVELAQITGLREPQVRGALFRYQLLPDPYVVREGPANRPPWRYRLTRLGRLQVPEDCPY